jgi:hypothetical protein
MSAERFTVLVVNDEPLLHRILHASLRSSGFAVEKARPAEDDWDGIYAPSAFS